LFHWPCFQCSLRQPNAKFQPPLEAEATEERTLQAVGCKPLFSKHLGSILCYDMGPQPRGKLLTVYLIRGYLENHMLLLVDSRTDFVAIQYQEDFHRGMPRPFVPVEKRMILDQGIAERCRFVHERRVQISAPKSHLRLRKSRL
jgi:hypothetical protein